MEKHGIAKDDAASIATTLFQWGVSAAMERLRMPPPIPADAPPVDVGQLALIEPAKPAKPKRPAMAKRRIPDDFTLTVERADYARKRGFKERLIDEMFEDFRNYYLKTGKCWSDWDAVWRTWVGNQVKRFNNGGGPGNDTGNFL
jgi:hypothetical protein